MSDKKINVGYTVTARSGVVEFSEDDFIGCQSREDVADLAADYIYEVAESEDRGVNYNIDELWDSVKDMVANNGT